MMNYIGKFKCSGKLLPVLGGCFLRDAFEKLVEISRIVKPAFVTHISYRITFVLQQLAGMTNAQFIQKPRKRFLRAAFEEPAKRVGCHIAQACQFLQFNIPVEILHQELVNDIDAGGVFLIIHVFIGNTGEVGIIPAMRQHLDNLEEAEYFFEAVGLFRLR